MKNKFKLSILFTLLAALTLVVARAQSPALSGISAMVTSNEVVSGTSVTAIVAALPATQTSPGGTSLTLRGYQIIVLSGSANAGKVRLSVSLRALMLADFLPPASPDTLTSVAWGLVVLAIIIDRGMSIYMNLQANRRDGVSRAELNARVVEVVTRIAADIEKISTEVAIVREERRQVSDKIFDRLELLEKSFSASLGEFSRALGRLEGQQDIANKIADALKTGPVPPRPRR